jgi:hypothetical protein
MFVLSGVRNLRTAGFARGKGLGCRMGGVTKNGVWKKGRRQQKRRRSLGSLPLPFCALFLGAVSNLAGKTADLWVEPQQPALLYLLSTLDDRDHADPVSYSSPGQQTRQFRGAVQLTYSGSHPLHDFYVSVNGEDFRSPEKILQAIGASENWDLLPVQSFNWLKDRIFHASSFADENMHLCSICTTYGSDFCNDDTRALSEFLRYFGVKGRMAPLNGHAIGEYFVGGDWRLIDGDQDLFFPEWDNRQLASYDDIRRDPLLAIRSKPYGKFAAFRILDSWFNGSLFERVASVKPKNLKQNATYRPEHGLTDLYPEEIVIFHPEQDFRATAEESLADHLLPTMRVVEHRINLGARFLAGENLYKSSVPILAVTDSAGRSLFRGSTRQPVYTFSFDQLVPENEITVYLAISQLAFPDFHKGENTVIVTGRGDNEPMLLQVEYHPSSDKAPDVPAVHLTESTDDPYSPRFQIEAAGPMEKIWWQISDQADFSLVVPNFDLITTASKAVSLDLISQTYFSPKRTYYFRARVKTNGVWSSWNEPLSFTVNKPERPALARVEESGPGALLLELKPLPDAEQFLVFGSNRLDFVPEIYSEVEPIEMRNGKLLKSRLNQNLLATSNSLQFVVPVFRFYRVVARRGAQYSVPSELISAPPQVAQRLPDAKILQTRWSTFPDPGSNLGYRDEYLASEMRVDLPP